MIPSLACWIGLAGPGLAMPQEPGTAPPGRLEALERSNLELQQRLARIEQDQAVAGEEQGDAGTAKVSVHVFADLGASYEQRGRDRHPEFAFGSVGLFVSAQLSDHLQVLSETLLEGDDKEVVLDQERLWTEWALNDALYLKFGLEHSLTSYFNRTYHHGKWLFRSIERPLLAEFEDDGGILPAHYQGLELGGAWQVCGGRLGYALVVCNGRGPDPTQRNITGDENDSKAIEAGLSMTPAGGSELEFGGALRFEEVPGIPGDPVRGLSVRQWTGSVFVDSRIYSVQLLAEAAVIADHDRLSGGNYQNYAGYLEVSKGWDAWTPYARFEARWMDRGDPFYGQVDADLDRLRQIFGVRYDASSNAALKLELGVDRFEQRDAGGIVSRHWSFLAGFQLAWVF